MVGKGCQDGTLFYPECTSSGALKKDSACAEIAALDDDAGWIFNLTLLKMKFVYDHCQVAL